MTEPKQTDENTINLLQRIMELEAALRRIAQYDQEPIWMDSRDDAANEMIEIACEALA
jgi:hypothetical protein